MVGSGKVSQLYNMFVTKVDMSLDTLGAIAIAGDDRSSSVYFCSVHMKFQKLKNNSHLLMS